MKSCLVIFQLLWVILSGTLVSAASPETSHPFPDPQTKLKFLLYLNEHVPTLFDDSVTYDIELFKLLDRQAYVLDQVQKDPVYQELQDARPARTEILVEPARTRAPAEFDEQKLQQLRTHLASEYQRVAAGDATRLPAEIFSRARRLSQVNLQGFLTGLIKTLPQAKQGELFRMSMAEKPRALARELPDELISRGFIAANFGIRDAVFSRDQAMKMLAGLIKDEAELRGLATLQLLLQDSSGKIPADPNLVLRQIRQVTGDQLIRLSDNTVLAEGVKRLLSTGTASQDKRLSGVLSQGIQTEVKALKTDAAATPLGKPGRPMKLVEVAPHIGIFRGCVGGDCASQFSFPYPNSPNEKVYFVRAPDGSVKGYVAATVLNAGGKPSLYLHTIAGARLSHEDAETIIQALHDVRRELGAEQVVLGTDAAIHRALNYEPLRQAMRSAASGSLEVPLSYPDAPLREYMKPFDKGTYDHPENNLIARIYSPLDENRPRIDAKLRESVLAPYKDRPVDRTQALQIGLRLQQVGRRGSAVEVIRAAKISPHAYRELRDGLVNAAGRPVGDFLKEIDALLKPYGVTSERWLKERPGLLAPGIFRSSDAFEARQLPKTLFLLKQSIDDPAFQLLLPSLVTDTDFMTSNKISLVMEALLSEGKVASDRAVFHILSLPNRWRNHPKLGEYLMKLSRNGNVDVEIIEKLLPLPAYFSNSKTPAILADIASRGKADPALIELLVDAKWADVPGVPETIQTVLAGGRADPEALKLLAQPRYKDAPETLEYLRRALAKPGQEAGWVNNFLGDRAWWGHPFAPTVMEELVKRHVVDSLIVEKAFEFHWPGDPKAWDYLWPILEKGTADAALVERLKRSARGATNPLAENPRALAAMEKIIERGAADIAVAERLADPFWAAQANAPRWFDTLYARGKSDSQLALLLKEDSWLKDFEKATRQLEALLQRGNADDSIARVLGTTSWISHPKRDQYLVTLLKRGNAQVGLAGFLNHPQMADHPRLLEFVDALTRHPKSSPETIQLLATEPLKSDPRVAKFLERALRDPATHEMFLVMARNTPSWRALPEFPTLLSRIAEVGAVDMKLAELVGKFPEWTGRPESVDDLKKLIFRGRAEWYLDASIGGKGWTEHVRSADLAIQYIESLQDVSEAFGNVLSSPDWQGHARFNEIVRAALRRDPRNEVLIKFLKNADIPKLPHSEEWLAEALLRKDLDALLEEKVLTMARWKAHPKLLAACPHKPLTAECLRNGKLGKVGTRYRPVPSAPALTPAECMRRFHLPR